MGTKSFNPLGDTRRKQWLSVMNMIEWRGDGSKSFAGLCDEMRKYINAVEDVLEEMENENGD